MNRPFEFDRTFVLLIVVLIVSVVSVGLNIRLQTRVSALEAHLENLQDDIFGMNHVRIPFGDSLKDSIEAAKQAAEDAKEAADEAKDAAEEAKSAAEEGHNR